MIDSNGHLLCRMQGEIFENFSLFFHCSPYVFIRRFMNSKLAERFDSTVVLGDVSSNESFYKEIEDEYNHPTTFGEPNLYSKEALYWVGYIYRYWSYTYNVSSRILFQHVQPKVLFERYYIYHSYDPNYAIERLIETLHINIPPGKTLEELLEENLNEAIKGYQDK